MRRWCNALGRKDLGQYTHHTQPPLSWLPCLLPSLPTLKSAQLYLTSPLPIDFGGVRVLCQIFVQNATIVVPTTSVPNASLGGKPLHASLCCIVDSRSLKKSAPHSTLCKIYIELKLFPTTLTTKWTEGSTHGRRSCSHRCSRRCRVTKDLGSSDKRHNPTPSTYPQFLEFDPSIAFLSIVAGDNTSTLAVISEPSFNSWISFVRTKAGLRFQRPHCPYKILQNGGA